jgi:peptidoglycan-N-acetylglucosamine deacetylase
VTEGRRPPGRGSAGRPLAHAVASLLGLVGVLLIAPACVRDAAVGFATTEKYRTAAEIAALAERERERGVTFPKLVRGNPARREIALTFDDGPHPNFTPRLLDLLRSEGVPATFFVVGKMVDRHPELARREAAEGHEVANHTYNHVRLVGLPRPTVEDEIRRGSDAIARAIGQPTRYYRPPGGEYDDTVIEATRAVGATMVLWTDDPGDYARPGTVVIRDRTLRWASNGAILLLHDGAEETLQALPEIIRSLKARGYVFVTVSQLAREPGDVTTGGPRVPPPPLPGTPGKDSTDARTNTQGMPTAPKK